jgi:hypothetical protein
MNLRSCDIADPVLYRLYWAVMLPDVLHKLGFDATKENKMILHEFHKRVLEFDSIANQTQGLVSHFLFLVGVYWSQYGIFVRTRKDHPVNLLDMPLRDVWEYL